MTSFILTVSGQDRPGLVELLAQAVAAHGGNWMDSHLMRLGGKFAGVVRVEVAPEQRDPLRQALAELDAKGLTVTCIAEDETSTAETRPTAQLNLIGSDRPGIVREVSRVLAAKHVNVIDFHSESVGAPMTGGRMFQASIRLRLPDNCPWEEVQAELERIAADLMVDVTFAGDTPSS